LYRPVAQLHRDLQQRFVEHEMRRPLARDGATDLRYSIGERVARRQAAQERHR